MLSKHLATIVLLVNRNKEAMQSMRLKTCAKGSITWYGVTPQVYWFNKSDYKGNVSLSRLPWGCKWNFPAGSIHIFVNWIPVNVDGREYATGHCANAFTHKRSYLATISQNFTYVPNVLIFFLLYIGGCPWSASSHVTKDLKETKNRLRNKYWV